MSGDPPMLDQGDPLGQAIGLLEVPGTQQHGRAFPVKLVDDPPQLLARARVQTGGRLVEQHDRRELAGEPDPANQDRSFCKGRSDV
jgi:hypothetical protein